MSVTNLGTMQLEIDSLSPTLSQERHQLAFSKAGEVQFGAYLSGTKQAT